MERERETTRTTISEVAWCALQDPSVDLSVIALRDRPLARGARDLASVAHPNSSRILAQGIPAL
jgi:hypothetical protein